MPMILTEAFNDKNKISQQVKRTALILDKSWSDPGWSSQNFLR